MKLTNFLLFLFLSNAVIGQNTFDIKNPQNNYYKKCDKCLETLNKMPKEVQLGLQSDILGNIYFVMSDKTWFDELFKKSGDGIAVDIVSKDQYICGGKNKFKHSWASRGKLLPPVYLKDLKKNTLPSQYKELIIKVGKVPVSLKNKEIEFNLILLHNKYLCHYNTFLDVKRYRWDLLDMGLYTDTITYKSKVDTTDKTSKKTILLNKRLKFIIPFEKNKTVFLQKDIKPLYDSLMLTDYDIINIEIRAFSSVEGSKKHNIELQEKRAENIVAALQNFQTPKINQKIIASENWIEFFDDISNSPFKYLTKLSEPEIKEKLKDKKLLLQLEPYLSKHRKAVLIIDLEKKKNITISTPKQILKEFEKAVSDKNIEEAVKIQKSVFSKIIDNKLPSSILKSIEIPEKTEYSLLLNNQTALKYMIDEADLYSTYSEFLRLQDIFPNDGHIKYNICALKFRIWILGKELIDPKKFKLEIINLKKFGINQKLINRMLVNYNIIMCEYYMVNNDYKNKDKSLKYIYTRYKYLDNSDEDILSIAQYLVSFAKYDWAIKILKPKVKKIDANEDLLFYYLNLTIADTKQTKRYEYKTIMLNAVNMNKNRFCKLFSSISSGGISFQLLENEFIKKTYCENCK